MTAIDAWNQAMRNLWTPGTMEADLTEAEILATCDERDRILEAEGGAK